MKFFIIIALFLSALATFLGGAALISPYYFYSKILKGESYPKWYEIKHFDKRWLMPETIPALKVEEDANPNLWQNFHMKDVVIPLPVRNPFYHVLPILDGKNKDYNLFGLSFFGTDKREIAKVFFIQNAQFLNRLNAQELFKLPLVRQELMSYQQEDLWNDVFTKKIGEWNIAFDEMVRNLYLLEVRANFLPENFIKFGLMQDSEYALIEVQSQNKDFNCEYIFTRNKGIIYSMVLYTRKGSPEASKVRHKFLSGLSFRPTSKSLSSIIHKEFMGLPYNLRTDQLGMLYLLSAWSHDPSLNYVKEMIEFLERGEGNELQLEVLYNYAYDRYKMTFASRNLDIGSGEVRLRKSIELENQRELKELKKRAEEKVVVLPELSKEEELKLILNKAKKEDNQKENEILFD